MLILVLSDVHSHFNFFSGSVGTSSEVSAHAYTLIKGRASPVHCALWAPRFAVELHGGTAQL